MLTSNSPHRYHTFYSVWHSTNQRTSWDLLCLRPVCSGELEFSIVLQKKTSWLFMALVIKQFTFDLVSMDTSIVMSCHVGHRVGDDTYCWVISVFYVFMQILSPVSVSHRVACAVSVSSATLFLVFPKWFFFTVIQYNSINVISAPGFIQKIFASALHLLIFGI